VRRAEPNSLDTSIAGCGRSASAGAEPRAVRVDEVENQAGFPARKKRPSELAGCAVVDCQEVEVWRVLVGRRMQHSTATIERGQRCELVASADRGD
jgi:hypothetical protein